MGHYNPIWCSKGATLMFRSIILRGTSASFSISPQVFGTTYLDLKGAAYELLVSLNELTFRLSMHRPFSLSLSLSIKLCIYLSIYARR